MELNPSGFDFDETWHVGLSLRCSSTLGKISLESTIVAYQQAKISTCQTLRLNQLSSKVAEFRSVTSSVACARKSYFRLLI